MADQLQTVGSHRRFIPAWHFFVLPVLSVNVFVTAMAFGRRPDVDTAWALAVATALVLGMFIARTMPLRAQDRIIRLEERLRLEQLLPADLRGRIIELTLTQLIGLRFAADDEVVELTRRVLDGELKDRGDIKNAIQNWRADHLRV
jgi:hypothetical protein